MTDRDRYTERVNRVQDHIAEHLDGDLSLERLAGVACFSRFHFHRIFRIALDETLNEHVRRVRLERAAQRMRAAPGDRLTDIALSVGFAGLAEFSRAFKAHFGLPPSAWDRRTPLQESNLRQAPSGLPRYDPRALKRMEETAEIDARQSTFPRCRMVYFRVHDPYGNQRLVDAYHALQRWLEGQGLALGEAVVVGMSRDDPEITPPEQCRYDMGAAFPLDLAEAGVLGEVLDYRGMPAARRHAVLEIVRTWERGRTEFPDGMSVRDFPSWPMVRVACVGDLALVDRAFQYLYRWWLPRSRYRPADVPAMELFRRLPEEIGWETFDLVTGIALEDDV